MGILDRLFKRLGHDEQPLLAQQPERMLDVEESAAVRTADDLLIVTMPARSCEALQHGIATKLAVRFGADSPQSSRPVTFVLADEQTRPVLDPTLGWIIPMSAAARSAVAAIQPGATGEFMLEEWLALVLE